jgi:pimeloyl-ACP methyl ester carboxylesterase
MMHRLLVTLICVLGACATGRVEDPIPTAMYPKSEQEPARTLVIMLPGAGDRLGKFEKMGFVAAMHESGMDVDVLEVDAHYRYYKTRTLLPRMEGVLAPNRDRYEEIWVVGLSMGGLGALLTAWTYPEDIDGLVLIAPYMGRPKVLKQIIEAGGLAEWQPPAEEGDWDLEIWKMLKRVCESGEAGRPKIRLMYGVDDFGFETHELLAAELPKDMVETTEGGHAWPVWTRLWAAMIADRPFK